MKEKVSQCSKIKNYLLDDSNAIPLKSSIFLFNAGAICVFPIFVLHMQLHGISIKEIALINLIVPISSLLGPILSGMIADKLGKFNVVVAVNMACSLVLFSSMLLVPAVEKDIVYATCFANETPHIFVPFEFEECQWSNKSGPFNVTVQNCQLQQENNLSCANATSAVSSTCSATDLIIFHLTPNGTLEQNGNYSKIATDKFTIKNLTTELPIECAENFNVSCELVDIGDCPAYKESKLYSSTFYSYFLVSFIGHFVAAAAFTMLDATLLAAARKYNLDLGRQKIMAIIAFGVAPLIAGALNDYHSKKIGETTYFASFMLANGFGGLAVIIMLFMNISVKKNEENMCVDLSKLVRRLDVVLVWLIVLILGCNFGFIESYMFIYLKSLGASNVLLGLTMTVGCLASIPMLFYADWFENKVGRQYVFLICFTAYACRMLGYSYIKNPWFSLIFEMLEAITYQLMWVTLLKLCPILAPKGMLATMTGVTGSIHYCFGKGIGGFLGGYLITKLGYQKAYRAFAGIAVLGGLLYFILHHCYLKKKIQILEKAYNEEVALERDTIDKAKISITVEDMDQSHLELPTKTEYHTSLLALASPVTNIPAVSMSVRRRSRTCISVYDNLPGDYKNGFVGNAESLYPLKDLAKSESHLNN